MEPALGRSSQRQEFDVKRILVLPKLSVVTLATKRLSVLSSSLPASEARDNMVELQTGSGPAPTTAGVFPFPLLPFGEHLLFAPLAQLAFESVCAHAGAEFSAAQLDRPVILRKYDVALKAGTLNRPVSISRLQLARMRAETTEAFFCDRSATVIAAFAIDRGPLIAKMPCRTRAGTSHTHIAGDLRGIAVKSGSADGTYRIGSMRMCILVEPAGRYASCLRSALVERRPLNVSIGR